jgi:hypothetical protein
LRGARSGGEVFPRDFSLKWKVVFIVYLVLLAIGGVVFEDYVIPGALIASGIGYLMDPKRSKTQKVAQLALFGITIILASVHFYMRIKTARQ